MRNFLTWHTPFLFLFSLPLRYSPSLLLHALSILNNAMFLDQQEKIHRLHQILETYFQSLTDQLKVNDLSLHRKTLRISLPHLFDAAFVLPSTPNLSR